MPLVEIVVTNVSTVRFQVVINAVLQNSLVVFLAMKSVVETVYKTANSVI
jgi:hypothetical protein